MYSVTYVSNLGSIVGLFTSQKCCSFNPSSDLYVAFDSSIPRYHFVIYTVVLLY